MQAGRQWVERFLRAPRLGLYEPTHVIAKIIYVALLRIIFDLLSLYQFADSFLYQSHWFFDHTKVMDLKTLHTTYAIFSIMTKRYFEPFMC